MKKKKVSKFLAVAATTTMAVTPLGETEKVLASPTTESEVASTKPSSQQAKVSKFDLYGKTDTLNAYNEQFKVKNPTVTSNSGSYPGTSLNNLFDGTRSTHWETNKSNSETYTNELTFTFETATELDRIVYAPRTTGAAGKGFPLAFEIQGNKEDGGEFEVIATGTYSGSRNDAIEIEIEPTQFKQLKFVFTNASEGWAAASEFMFYKQDEVAEKVDRVFSNDELTKVSDEFKEAGVLEALAKEVETHPLKEQLIDRIEDAKAVLAMKDIEPSMAETTVFEYYNNEAYKNEFMVPLTNIESITNNGGHYAQSVLNNAIDGDTSTYWETRSYNTADFKNTVEVEFKDAVTIDRLVYGARPSDRKGFVTGFDIYISPTSEGETYQLVSSGGHSKVSGLVEAKFDPTKAKRVKFVAKESDQNWATLSELAFFKQDTLADKVAGLFTDGTQSKLVTEYNSLDKITALENEAKNHLLYDELKTDLELAKKIVQGQVATEGTIITAEQVGNRKGFIYNTLRTDVGSNLQPTGLAVKAGKTITVYVEANGATKLPTMVFSQSQGAWSNWNRSVQLSPGKNVITVPEVPKDNKYHYDVTKGGMIYIINPYTKEQQGGAPVIRIEGADRVPFMTKDTDPAEFKQFLTEYKEKIDADKEANPNVADREVLDVVEIVSDHVIYTGTASAAYNAYVTQNKDPKATVDGYDEWMHQIFEVHGLDDRSETHSTDLIREPIRVMQPWGFMYAAGDHTGIQTPQEGLMFGDFRVNYPGWGLNHEIGHRIDLGAREWAEVTNNMTSMAMSVVAGNIDNRIPYESIYTYVLQENKATKWGAQGLAHRLGTFWQLELAHDGYWAELESLYRERKGGGGNDTQKQQTIIKYSSDVLKEDLSTYFEKHGFDVTEETREYTKQYGESGKYWYLNNSVINYKGTGFTDAVKVDINISSNESAQTHTLSFEVNDEDQANVLGYEILRDGEAIGFTAGSSFTVKNVDTTQATEYQVVAYDKKLGASNAAAINSFKPTISTEDNLTIKLRDENFDPLNHVKAIDVKGNDITDSVKVKSNNVDLTKKGDYQIVYEVTNQEITATKTMNVTVTSDFDYLSDLSAKSHNIAWGGLQLNKAPQGTAITLLRDGVATIYEKGIGAHANSEVVYDIEGKGYNYFESYIGIDQAMAGNNSSATFEVWVDDEKVYASNVFGSRTEHAFIKVPIKAGAKTVKLVTTDAGSNGNTADHTVWADAKFTKDSSKPTITVGEAFTDVAFKDGTFSLLDGVTAFDPEDGDMTSKITVDDDGFAPDKPGKYDITYTVEDTDGNVATATKEVYVYSDVKYASDVDWQSATTSWGQVRKDQSVENQDIKLLVNGNVKIFDKGIGTHADSTIVYDLTDKEFDYFESWVGVERSIAANNKSSITYKVLADGKEVFNSGVMNYATEAKHVKVSLAGVEKLELIVDDGGSNESDHAAWADAKFYVSNSKPQLTIPEDVVTKVGTAVDLAGEITATDAEDGNLTSAVTVVGEDQVDFDKAGDYKVTYTVVDSNGNEVTKTRTVSVVDMRDFNYLSAYNWKSESHSYAAPVKDKATSGNALRLTGDDGNEVVYDKGIGAHSNSTIVYDLTDKEAAYFTSYVGVDRQMYNSVGSVVFQVYVDGEKKFDSGLMTAKMAQQYVEVNLAGAKELKLVVTDGGNGNGSDHATWGDAKLHYANEDRPKAEEVVETKEAVETEAATVDEEIVTAEENINRIVQVVKDALNDDAVDISQIKAIVAGNPANTKFSGLEAELAVKAIIEEQFADIPGTFEIVLHNRGTSETIEDLIQSGLTITYQVDDSESTYTYKNGSITKN